MFSIRDLFNPRCKGEIIVYRQGIVGGEITQQKGRIDLSFAVQLKLTDAKINFPKYISHYLDGYELSMNGNNDFYLALHFISGGKDKYLPALKHSLELEVRKASPKTTIHKGNNGSTTWCTNLENLNSLLDHLAKPAIQNSVITRANVFLAQKTSYDNAL